jgi:hypothetical protein
MAKKLKPPKRRWLTFSKESPDEIKQSRQRKLARIAAGGVT